MSRISDDCDNLLESLTIFRKRLESRVKDTVVHYSLEEVLTVVDILSSRNVSDSEYRAAFQMELLKGSSSSVDNEDGVGVRSLTCGKDRVCASKRSTSSPKSHNVTSGHRGGYKKIPLETPLLFKSESHKRGKAAERYEMYKEATTIGEYKELNNTAEQQKDLEHAIVHKLVKIDTSNLKEEEDSVAMSWINKCLKESTTAKEKKNPKKQPTSKRMRYQT